ncbi:MAG: NfeD family protein [Deltaproteobacteria bacterium]|nr:NfeD family protein [Deltaproteobacteria bacterium]
MFENVTLFWFCLGFVLFVMEMATPGVFFLFFGLGAWIVMLVAAFISAVPFWFQWSLFSASSLLSLIFLRKRVISVLARKRAAKVDSLTEPMVAERYLGQDVDILEDVSPAKPGIVEFNGTRWQGKSQHSLAAGSRGRIVEVDGLVLWVEPVDRASVRPPSPSNQEGEGGA